MKRSRALALKARRVKLLLLDVDGVMTDGGLYYSAKGVAMKRFHAQDGYGVVRAHEHGLRLAIVSGRSTPVVDARARTLKITDVFQNAEDKVAAMRKIQHRDRLSEDEIAFIGDELFDLPLLRVVGLSAAPADARPEVKRAVDLVTTAKGGEGAVREVIDFIISHQT
jgi:3-deoxy-D-manno-octulosonate 8-phosphate phosphatase (KDO 8-P phosphatase)